ncbi:MAG: HEAT repeat domain-containing protein [Nitrospirae bacterium]|nr:HEAT repeat domain-containing protein [Nitrospirota bacterium]MBF0535047.1 HEAT repeat domain-containing protein [Nitrospirota bacterium]MBF0616555.1 HEAT repeat domain-containing protein [Nitrospirota bacterium]
MNKARLEKLKKSLNHSDVSRRRQAASMLGEGDERAIYPLITALFDKSLAVQDSAAQSLIQIGGEAVAYMTIPVLRKEASQRNAALLILKDLGEVSVPFLYDLLKDRDEDMRKFAVDLLGDIHIGVDYELLIPMFKDENANVRAATCRSFGLLNVKEGVKYLKKALSDPEEWVAFTALEALGAMESEEGVTAISELCNGSSLVLKFAAFETLGKIPSKQSKDALIECTKTTDSFTKSVAVKSLVQIGIEPDMLFLAPDLRVMLQSDDWEDRFAAISGLSVIKDKDSLYTLLDMAGSLDTSYPENEEHTAIIKDAVLNIADCSSLLSLCDINNLKFRGMAILVETLGKLKCVEAIDTLVKLLRSSLRDIRREAAHALVEIADERCVDSLIEALSDEDGHVRKQSIYALRKLKAKKSFLPILDLISKEGYEDVVDEGVKALLSMDSSKFLHKASSYPENFKIYIAKYAQETELLLDLSKDDSKSVKIAAISRLGSFNQQNAYDRLSELLNDNDLELRRSSAMTLSQYGVFVDALLTAVNDSDMWVRFYALKAIAATKGAEYPDLFAQALNDRENLVVMGAIDALSILGGQDAYEAIYSIRDHTDDAIRQRVEEVLQSL